MEINNLEIDMQEINCWLQESTDRYIKITLTSPKRKLNNENKIYAYDYSANNGMFITDTVNLPTKADLFLRIASKEDILELLKNKEVKEVLNNA